MIIGLVVRFLRLGILPILCVLPAAANQRLDRRPASSSEAPVVQANSPATLTVVLSAPVRVPQGSEWEVSCVVTNQGSESLGDIGIQISRVPGLELLEVNPGTLEGTCCANLVVTGISTNLPAAGSAVVNLRFRTALGGVFPVTVLAFHGTNDPSPSLDEKIVYTERPDGQALAPNFSVPFASVEWSAARFQWVAWTGRSVVFLAPRTLLPLGVVRFPGVASGFQMSSTGQQAWGILETGEAARLNLSTGMVDLSFPLPPDLAANGGVISPVPGLVNVLVSFGPDAGGQPTVVVFDNGVARPGTYTNELAAVAGPYRLTVSEDYKVYAALGSQLRELLLEDAGVTLMRNLDSLGHPGTSLSTVFGFLYGGGEEVLNLRTSTAIPSGLLGLGLADGIAYGARSLGDDLEIRAFDLNTQPPGVSWRQRFLSDGPAEVISGGFFAALVPGLKGGLVLAPDLTPVDLSIQAQTTNKTAAVDGVVTVTVQLSRTGNWSAVNTRLFAELSDGLAAVNPASSSNRWILPVGTLDEDREFTLTFQVTQPGPQSVTLRADSAFSDPNLSDNEVTVSWNLPDNQLVLENTNVADNGTPLTLRLLRPADEAVEIPLRVELLSASTADVTSTNLVAKFGKGKSSTTIDLVAPDEVVEVSETLRLFPKDSPLGTTQPFALITITNDDRVTLSVASIVFSEAEASAGPALLTLVLSGASDLPLTVGYTLEGVTATAGLDFVAASGERNFARGQRTNLLPVVILDDSLTETVETLRLLLTAPSVVILPSEPPTITIQDDESIGLEVADVTVPEGDSGVVVHPFTLVLSAPPTVPLTVGYSLMAATATAGTDFEPAAGEVTFAIGQQTNVVGVSVMGDTRLEANETLRLALTVPAGVFAPLVLPRMTIVDDDKVTLTAADVAEPEGNSGVSVREVTLLLSAAADIPVVVGYSLVAGTASAGVDFEAASGEVTFAPGQQTNVVPVRVIGDTILEADEELTVQLTVPGTVNGPAAAPRVKISNDDRVVVRIADVLTAEGDEGSRIVPLRVTLDSAAEIRVEVGYSLRGGSATAGSDFTAASGVLTFSPGERTNVISVEILGDREVEPDETVFVDLSGRGVVDLPAAPGVLTIQNDEQSSVPVVLRVRLGSDGILKLSINSESGQRYQIQSRADLSRGSWADRGPALSGTGGDLEFEIDPLDAQSYFRVRVR